MNVEKNGQHVNEDDDNNEDDVNLTAYALGEISDPAIKERLDLLLKEDDTKRADFDATLQLASMIRESVDDDLPLAPGSLHNVVLAELGEHFGDGAADIQACDNQSQATVNLDSNGAVAKNEKHSRSESNSFLSGNRAAAFAITLCLMITCTFAIWRPWETKTGTPDNLALATDNGESSSNEENTNPESMKGETLSRLSDNADGLVKGLEIELNKDEIAVGAKTQSAVGFGADASIDTVDHLDSDHQPGKAADSKNRVLPGNADEGSNREMKSRGGQSEQSYSQPTKDDNGVDSKSSPSSGTREDPTAGLSAPKSRMARPEK